MKRYVEGDNRFQSTLFPESLDDYIAEDNPVRVVDVFVEELDLKVWSAKIRLASEMVGGRNCGMIEAC